jgi:hypothetical protein
MQYVQYSKNLLGVLAKPNPHKPDESHMLDTEISNDLPESLYLKVAIQLLRLFETSFPRIGSLAHVDGNTFPWQAGPPPRI